MAEFRKTFPVSERGTLGETALTFVLGIFLKEMLRNTLYQRNILILCSKKAWSSGAVKDKAGHQNEARVLF